ncbi:MAG: polysaccharide biosynthesis tyrosine autokinase [Dehalococcoidia bacterium]
MELARYLRLARRWWWLMLVGLLVGAGTAWGISQLMTPVYSTSATLLVNQTQTPGTIAYNDILTSERLTKTYSELITKRPVLEEVIADLGIDIGPDELASMIGVEVVRDTQLLRLSVEDSDPILARRLANASARAFIEVNQEDQLTRSGSVSIVEPAVSPGAPISPRTTMNTLLGAFAGLLLAAAAALLYEYLDDTVKTPEDVEVAAGGLATLGGVARFPRRRGTIEPLIAASTRRTAAAEAYKVLRTNVQFSTVDQPAQVMLVSSASPGEGKTTTTANLAIAMAQTGQRVVVVDADLRRPSLHRIFSLPNQSGLTNALLAREQALAGFLQTTPFENLSVMTSGPLPPNPSELLSSRRLDTVIEALRKQADVVIFDSPPALAVADASILAGKVDGAILVVDAGRTRGHALQRAQEALSRSKTRVLGAVLNKLTERGRGYYYSYNYYAADDGTKGRGARLPWRRKSRRTAAESRSYA